MTEKGEFRASCYDAVLLCGCNILYIFEWFLISTVYLCCLVLVQSLNLLQMCLQN